MNDLRPIITDLRGRLNALPHINSHDGATVMDQHRAHRAAAQELADHLTETYGALIRERHDGHVITMKGIRSSSTSGLAQTCRNWIAAAEKRLSS